MKKLHIYMTLVIIFTLFSCNTSKNTIVRKENQFPSTTRARTVGNIDVMVDPNVELMDIIQRLAGQPPFVSANDVPYLSRVDEYFEPYKYCTAVTRLRVNEMAYGRASEFGMYLNSDDSDLIMKPDNKIFVIRGVAAKNIPYYCLPTFREAVRDFRIESKFDQFFLSHAEDYEELIEKYVQILKTAHFDSWLEDFYGTGQKEKLCLYVTKLTGNYGISFVNPKGKIIPHAVIMDRPFAEGPLFLISHEFSHPMTYDIAEELYKDPSIRRIFDSLYDKYSKLYLSLGYGSGKDMLHETINQACANKFNEKILPEDAMRNISSIIEARKYEYVPAVAEFLDNYQNNRSKYKTLKAFVPELKKFLATLE